ncbi:MAG: AAA family ATPase [Candidatus Accumulibacter sp.]|jgi:predicted ATPase|nr:AAA family ATPase [Accumulibacter sp.]
MLTDVTIEGLRGVGRVELHFAPGQRVYTLFGENGVGKTKCLEALYQFLLAANKSFVQDYWVKQRNEPVSRNLAVMARMWDKSTEGLLEVPDQGDFFSLEQIWKEKVPLHSIPVVFIGADRRASLAKEDVVLADVVGTSADRRQAYFDDLYKVLHSGHLSDLGMTGSTRTWLGTRARSANPYQKSKDNRKVDIDTVLSILNVIEPSIDREYLKIDGRGNIFLKVGENERELGVLSSGYAALVKLIQAIVAGYAAFTNEVQLQNVRGIVLIDEIDSHLHAQWQVRIIPLLKKLLPNTTFYVATHSPLVLSQLLHGEAHLLKRGDDGVVRSQLLKYPGRRNFIDVLEDTLGVDLNKLKLDSFDLLGPDEQEKIKAQMTEAKGRLLKLLEEQAEA